MSNQAETRQSDKAWQPDCRFPAKSFLPLSSCRGIIMKIIASLITGWIILCSPVLLLAKDIGSDTFPLQAGETTTNVIPLSKKEKRQAEAFTEFAVGYYQLRKERTFSKETTEHFLNALKNDPLSDIPLKMLIGAWGAAPDRDKLRENLLPLAKKYPQALRINLLVAELLNIQEKYDQSKPILEASYETIAELPDAEKAGNKDIFELVATLGALYGQMKIFDEGEDFFDEVLDDEVFADNMKVRMAAVLFYSLQADQGEDGWFIFESRKERCRRKLETNLQVIEKLWQEKAAQVFAQEGILPVIELSPLFKVYKRYNMLDRGEDLLLDTLLYDPANQRVLLFLTAVLADAGKYHEAWRIWDIITKQSSEQPEFHFEQGRMALLARNYDQAVKAFEWYLLLRPDDPTALYQLGLVYFDTHRNDKAIYKLQKISKMPEAYYLISLCHHRKSRYQQAAEALAEAERIAKKEAIKDFLNREFYLTYASFCEKAKDIPKTVSILQELREQHPDDAEIANFLGYLWADRDEHLEEAKKLIEIALEKEPENAAFLDSMAWVLYRLGKPEEAVRFIADSLEHEGDLPDAVISDHAGDIYLQLGKKDLALKYWRLADETVSDDLNREAVREKIKQLTEK